jgi:hypothetical protein
VIVIRKWIFDMVYTRPNLAHTISVMVRIRSNLEKAHWKIVGWNLRLLWDTSNLCMIYPTNMIEVMIHCKVLLLIYMLHFLANPTKKTSTTCLVHARALGTFISLVLIQCIYLSAHKFQQNQRVQFVANKYWCRTNLKWQCLSFKFNKQYWLEI